MKSRGQKNVANTIAGNLKNMKNKPQLLHKLKRGGIAAVALVLLVLGYWLGGGFLGDEKQAMPQAAHDGHAEKAAKPEVWTCSMHPQIQLPEPGQCPICFMDLIPLDSGGDDDEAGPRELTVSANAAKLMELETAPVERRPVTMDVRMVGKVDYDETRLAYITAWVPGRIERLFVDYTGIPVRKGDHMLQFYSPEVLTAETELLQAINTVRRLEASDVGIVRETAMSTVKAAREKLRLWGLTPEQIAEIEQLGTPADRVTIYAPAGGVVVDKNAREGMYVETGTRIFSIADLSRVWIELDAYESDLAWLRYGQTVRFTTEAHPGERFTGKIAFIPPVLDEATRTVKIRVNVENKEGHLKPGMFVRAVVEAEVAGDGHVVDAELAGKWISPMHPEIVKDEPGTCDVCGMPLVPAEDLGYVNPSEETTGAPLVIPASAPLITGKRALVYVEVPNREKPTYEGREVILGARAGGVYPVKSGLVEGERVVTQGAFKLDAELQIRAKPSMMMPEDSDDATDHAQDAMQRPGSSGGESSHQKHGSTHEMNMTEASKPQTLCPVMGGKINRDIYVDYQGKRIYFCCPGCEETFLEDPEKYLEKMKAEVRAD
jgi:Cu(I)/Ag(I) efflux system membrane fusion protein